MCLKHYFSVNNEFSYLFAIEESNNSTTDINITNYSEKITLLYIDSENCKYCRKLDEMFHKPEPAKLIEKYFIIKRKYLNENMELPKGLPLPYGTPTVYFLNNKEEAIIEPMRGEKTEKDLLDFLNEAINENNRMLNKNRKKSKNLWEKSIDSE